MKDPESATRFQQDSNKIPTRFQRIYQFESTISQLSKALCGKENATLDELLKAADQLKSVIEIVRAERDATNKDRIDLAIRLAKVERERDVMRPVFIREMKKYGCTTCEHYIPAAYTQECLGCGNSELKNWSWNGVCPENTKEAAST